MNPSDLYMNNKIFTIQKIMENLDIFKLLNLDTQISDEEMSFYIDCILLRVEIPKIYGFSDGCIYTIAPNKYLLSIIHYIKNDFKYKSEFEVFPSLPFEEQPLYIKRRIRETVVNLSIFEGDKSTEKFIEKYLLAYKTQNLF